jgi:fibronectin type 3 domain-containing protein
MDNKSYVRKRRVIFQSIFCTSLMAIFLSCGGSTGTGIKQTNTTAHGVTLSWVTPSKNTDNSNVIAGDVAGYRVYYGISPGNYVSYIEVGNVNSYSLNIPDDGNTYYFAVTAYNAAGLESDFSMAVSATY